MENQTPVTPVNQKTPNFLVILLTILLIISLAIAGFFAFQTQKLVNELNVLRVQLSPVSTIEPSTTTDPIADWKTYSNTALGFELKYPPTVMIEKEMNDKYNRVTMFKDDNLNFWVLLLESKDISLDKYSYVDNPNYTKSTLDRNRANIYVYDASKSSCNINLGSGCQPSYITYVAQRGLDFYHVVFFGDDKLSVAESQILSTFKFTN